MGSKKIMGNNKDTKAYNMKIILGNIDINICILKLGYVLTKISCCIIIHNLDFTTKHQES